MGAEATIVRRVSRWRVARLHGSYRVWLGCNCQCSVVEQRRPASWAPASFPPPLRAQLLLASSLSPTLLLFHPFPSLPLRFVSFRSLSLSLSVRSTRPRFSFTSSSFATPFFAPHHFLASPSLSLLSNQPPPFSIPPCRASKRAQLASPFRFCSVPTSTSTLVELPRRRTHTSVCAKRVSAYLGMREAWPDRGTSGGTRKLRGREVTHGGGNPPPPFPMWLLPIDFVRVRGRSNTCYRVGWKRVEGTRRGQMEEEEEDRVGVGELMASG